jgi:uncharacterized protein YkwD
MLEFYPAILAAILHAGTCTMPVITNDSDFTDSYPAPVSWTAGSSSVGSIEIAFNIARAGDSTVTTLLKLPRQETWDTMNDQEKALYLLNKERYDRGLKPFEGYTADVTGVAQNYAQLLYNTGTFGHEEDGTPWERLDRVQVIADNRDFFTYAENLAVFAALNAYTEEPIVRSVYNWIYDDAGSFWGHRKFCLAKNLNVNSGENGKEGLIGIGIVQGTNYTYSNWQGYYSTVVVMDAFDPSSTWDHSTTKSVSLCSDSADTTTRFQINFDTLTVMDSQNGLMWMLRPATHAERADAVTACSDSTHAGFTDWILPNMAQAGTFHYGMDVENRNPPQLFLGCTAEIVSDGYVRTKQGSIIYGLNPGDPISFSGGANVRCVRTTP